MGRVAPRTDWLGRIHGLTEPTVSCADRGADGLVGDVLTKAQGRVAVLAAAARALAAAPEAPAATAALANQAGGTAALLLADDLLDALPLAPVGRGRVAGSGAALAGGYVDALRQAASAVYYCRTVQHPAGCCWFSVHGPEDDLCGRVLVTVHRLG